MSDKPYVITNNKNVPRVQEPVADIGSLLTTVKSLKQGLENLGGYRGEIQGRAVTFNDLIGLNLIPPVTFNFTTGVGTGGIATNDGLAAEAAARAAADADLEVQIDAEEAARIAADLALQGQIDAEEAARIAADALKAPIASPVLTGNPRSVTPPPGDSDTSIATTEFVTDAIAIVSGGTAHGVRIGTVSSTLNATVANGGILQFDTVYSDSDGYAPTTATFDRITIPAELGGLYILSALSSGSGTEATTLGMGVLVNGTQLISETNQLISGPASVDYTLDNVAVEIGLLSGGDYVQLRNNSVSVGTNVFTSLTFSMARIDPSGPAGAPGAGASPSTALPLMNGAAAPGASLDYSRGDHIHPTDSFLQDQIDDIAAGGGGTTILDGAGPPADALGAVGDYYVDAGTDFYGPKAASVSYGPGQSAVPAALSPSPGFSYPTIELGAFVAFAATGRISAVRYWRDSSTTQIARTVNIWHSTTHARLATETIANDGGGSGWKTITLTTPLLVSASDIVVVTVGNTNAYSRTDSATFPISDGGDVSLTQGTYGFALDTFPSTTAAINFFVDVVFQEGGGVWPLAVPGFPEAPTDGLAYGRQSAAWTQVLMSTGDVVDGGSY